VYRAEVVVSGRITPTRPDPAEVTLVSCDIAENELSKESTVRPAAADAADEGAD